MMQRPKGRINSIYAMEIANSWPGIRRWKSAVYAMEIANFKQEV
jgi:hypothetical protein